MDAECLQEHWAPRTICFGCGPSNEKGLRIRSFVEGGEVVARWQGEPHHDAFPGVLSGGIIGTLLDCHSNWTAAWHLMNLHGLAVPPSTVTAEFHVKLLRPTSSAGTVTLRAVPAEANGDRAVIEATLEATGKLTATCRGVFVAVKEGHPAFHRW